jgi:hypothetical protein
MTGGGWAERPLDDDDRDAEHLWILQQDEDEDEDGWEDEDDDWDDDWEDEDEDDEEWEDEDDHVLRRPSDDDWI